MQIQLKSLAEEMQAIIKGLEKLNQELTASENDGPVSEVFRKVLNLSLLMLKGQSFSSSGFFMGSLTIFLVFVFIVEFLDIERVHYCCWDRSGICDEPIFCGGNTLIINCVLVAGLILYFMISALSFAFGGQGRNADALALYFGEDPARCPFEQG